LGNYYLTKNELGNCVDNDFIIIVDLSLPVTNIEYLKDRTQVLIFDHHLGDIIPGVFHHNPVIKDGDPEHYPSTSWIVNDYLSQEPNLFAFLGVIGDHEYNVEHNGYLYPNLVAYCEKNKCTLDDLMNMAGLIDSNYKIGSKQAVENAPYVLFDVTDPFDIFKIQTWQQNRQLLEHELEQQLKNPGKTIDDIIVKNINTPYNLISTVTRTLAWKYQKDTIVINTGFFDDENQLYARSVHTDMQPMIRRGKQRGYKCGGKKEVLGAIISKSETDGFVKELLTYLNKQKQKECINEGS
jgi:hypothetical protein